MTSAAANTALPRPVLVVDFGAQYAQLIARRVREANVFSEVVPCRLSADEILARDPAAIILSGGPQSVYADGAPAIDPALFDAGVPVLGICYGFQAMTSALGGTVARTDVPEFGATPAALAPDAGGGTLLSGLPLTFSTWMSHGDAVSDAPEGFVVTASTDGALVAAFENVGRNLYGVQWHPEVRHSEHGQRVIERFLYDVCGLAPTWTPANFIEEQVAAIREQVGDAGVICALSGGVDSAVVAALVQRAIGDQLTCVHVDHGLMRAGETEQIERDYVDATGVRLIVREESDRFLGALAGVKDPETKRKIIGREFIRVFEDAQRDIVAADAAAGRSVRFLAQGTIYPDIVESGGPAGSDGAATATIKSHHNVGGLPDDLDFELVEPLKLLFKDEVRAVGRALGIPEEMVARQPFPGPGLGVRVIGELTRPNLDVLRRADAIVREELTRAGQDEHVWQCPVVLLADVRSVGVQGDGRTYGHPIVLRPVTSEDAMTADWARVPFDVLATISTRITNEVPEVNRVVLDVTSKPPGTIEWE